MDSTSNTGENRPTNKGQFAKGDHRINRKGRPRNFDALRKLAQQIGNEPTEAGMTRVELIFRSWSLSKNPVLQAKFIEYAYGKVPDNVEVGGKNGGEIKIIVTSRHEDDQG